MENRISSSFKILALSAAFGMIFSCIVPSTLAQEVPVKDQQLRQIATGINKDTTALVQKEYVINKAAKGIAQQAEAKVVGATTKEILTGNNGNPYFVTNQKRQDAITKAYAASHFYTTDLANVCQPIQTEVKQQVAAYVQGQSFAAKTSCTLDPSISDPTSYASYMAGDPTLQTWDNWYSIFQPQNGSLQAGTIADNQLDLEVQSAQNYENLKINQGNGFLPKETCVSKDEQGNCIDNEIITPGYTISNELNAALEHAQFDPFINSDNVDAVLNSIDNQIFNQVFSSGGSLLGLAAGGTNSFVSALGNASATGQNGANPVTNTGGGNSSTPGVIQVQGTLTKKSALDAMNLGLANLAPDGIYIQNKTASLALMDGGIASVQTIADCYSAKLASTTLALTADNIATANARIAYATSTVIAGQLQPVRDTIAGDISTTTIATITGDIQGLVDQMTKAKKIGVVASIFSSFQQFLYDNNLGDLTGSAQLSAITTAVTGSGGLDEKVAKGVAECEAFP